MSSVKVVDILKACKQSRMDQALGLNTPRNRWIYLLPHNWRQKLSLEIEECVFFPFTHLFCRFGGAVKSSNMTPPWGTSAPWSSSEASSETNSSSSSGPFNWNSSNAARYEQGTTFYSQVRQGKWGRKKGQEEETCNSSKTLTEPNVIYLYKDNTLTLTLVQTFISRIWFVQLMICMEAKVFPFDSSIFI